MPPSEGPLNMLKFQKNHLENKHLTFVMDVLH